MKLRDLLFSDLGRLLGRKRSEAPVREWGDLWFTRIFSPGSWHRPLRRKKVARFDASNYTPGRYYRSRSARWKGPIYLAVGHWRRDLLTVVDQIGAIVKTNAPLVPGLEACGREERRQRGGLSARNIFALAEAYGVMLSIILVGVYVGITQFDLFGDVDLPTLVYFCAVGAVAAVPGVFFLRRSGRLEAVFLTLRDDLSAGLPLSEAMARQRRFFPRFSVDLVKAGEESGRMGDCLDQLGDDTLHALTIGKGVVSNLLYLGFVFAAQMTILTFLSIRVLPVFIDIVQDFGGQLPGPARVMTGLVYAIFGDRRRLSSTLNGDERTAAWSLFVVQLLAVVVLFMIAAFLITRLRRRTFSTRSMAAVLLLIPGLRSVVVHRNLAVVSLILEKLLRAGVPLERALESAANSELNPLYERSVRRVRQRILQGESLGDAWNAEKGRRALAPASFCGLVLLGERSGMLPDAFGRLAEFYGRQAEKRVRIISDALMPLGVLLLGGITLSVELAVFLTLTSIYNVIMGSL